MLKGWFLIIGGIVGFRVVGAIRRTKSISLLSCVIYWINMDCCFQYVGSVLKVRINIYMKDLNVWLVVQGRLNIFKDVWGLLIYLFMVLF